ncbi:hypothetical protein BDW59DRAFT_161059 [Aspergillus cavernicola]|uniref:Transferase family-domain-containing protein n=1 Tax=Aspergillus cavernicola TaxID=176166 RepID=A0ABR4IER5_9EURO
MELLRHLMGWQSQEPTKVPTDTVIPLPRLPPYHFHKVELVLKFDRVLDPDKLRGSLDRLLEMGNWRQLGGRLRRRKVGKLVSGTRTEIRLSSILKKLQDDPKNESFELHVPGEFTAERPAYRYTTSVEDCMISDHPVASKFPAATSGISIVNLRDLLRPLINRSGLPLTAKDWVCSDYGALFFEQINFLDASLILIMFPHHLMDMTGFGIFVKSWVAVLHGREADVLPLASFSYSLLDALADKTPADRYIWYNHLVKWPGTLLLTARALWGALWGKEERLICIPGSLLDKMRDEAIKELAVSEVPPYIGHNHSVGDKVLEEPALSKPLSFVSHSDVLVAWFTRLAASAASPSPATPLVLSNSFDIRPFALPSDAAYLMNSVCTAYTILPISKVLSQPISFLAAQLRHALDRERTMEQIEARYAWAKHVGFMSPIGSANMLQCIVTNWNKAGLFHLDFSPAVVDRTASSSGGAQSPAGGPCVASGFCNTSPLIRMLPNCGVILGRDSQGNWWMQWFLPRSSWAEIEKRLQLLSETVDSPAK